MDNPSIGFRDILLIGGPRHGTTVQLKPGNQIYVDLRSGTSYTLQTFARPMIGPLGVVNGAKAHDVLIMDGMLGGRTFAEANVRRQKVQQLIADVIVGRWFANEGYDVPIQTMPSGNGNGGGVTAQPNGPFDTLPPGGVGKGSDDDKQQ